jgi:hypothetical protein
MAVNGKKRLILRPLVTIKARAEGHPPVNPPKNLAVTNKHVKANIKAAPHLLDPPAKRLLRHLRHQPGRATNLLLLIAISPERFSI